MLITQKLDIIQIGGYCGIRLDSIRKKLGFDQIEIRKKLVRKKINVSLIRANQPEIRQKLDKNQYQFSDRIRQN